MICVINLYEVEAANIDALASAFDVNGPWHRISNRLPGHLHTNLLRRSTGLLFFMIQEYWESERDYLRAENDSEAFSFRLALRTLVGCQQCLGIFRFRDQWERELDSDHTYRKPSDLRNWQMD